MSDKRVVIDFLPHKALRYLDWDAIVCIGVMRATTTLVTSVGQGRDTYAASSVEEALELAARLDNPLLAGEIRGYRSHQFELQNSPSAIARLDDETRPLVLASTSGTKLIGNASKCTSVYVASFRNLSATASHVARQYRRVALIGAGSEFECRREDQICASWLAGRLKREGFQPENDRTRDLVQRWSAASLTDAATGKSAAFLRETGQKRDVDFILGHFDDLDIVCALDDHQIRKLEPTRGLGGGRPGVRRTQLARARRKSRGTQKGSPRGGRALGSAIVEEAGR